MHTLANLAKALNRPIVYLQGLQKRFALPIFKDATYSDAYLLFLQTIINMRTLNVAEDVILDLWHTEKKLLQLIHADSTGSPTWFLDSCGSKGRPHHRLLLSNFDICVDIASGTLQLGLQFTDTAKELFTGTEMGEDAIALLKTYIVARTRIQSTITTELPHLRAALRLAKSKTT